MVKKKIKNIDGHMMVIREFLDLFYNKTIFKNEQGQSGDVKPSLIKLLFAFIDPKMEYPIGELGKIAQVKSSTITDMVDRVEQEGLVERIRDNNDRRLVKFVWNRARKRT